MRQFSHVYKLLFTLGIVVVGIAFIVFGIIGIKQDNTWPDTQGIIQSIELVHEAVDSEDTDEYEVMVKYTVDGKTYESDLHEYQDDFEVGKEITIRYNPEAPDAIVLPGKTVWIIAIIAGALVALGGIFTFLRTLIGGSR